MNGSNNQGDRLKQAMSNEAPINPETGLQIKGATASSNTGFPEIKNLTRQDVGLNPDINQQDLRADNQSGGKKLLNGLIQMTGNTIGELIASPGYAASIFEPIEETEKGISGAFIHAGDWIMENVEELAPIYRSNADQERIFDPTSAGWWANKPDIPLPNGS